jgi:threonine/homoserine/homoserine lactone efflux protein
LVHVGYTLLGVGLLMQQSPWLFEVVKLLGAAYLIYLGVTMLRTRPGSDLPSEPAAVLSNMAALRRGFLTNALNPKTTVFVVSLFLQIVGPQTPLATQLAYGGFISLAHVGWFCIVALCFSAQRVRGRLLAVRHWIDRAFGSMLVGFGVLLAAAKVTF